MIIATVTGCDQSRDVVAEREVGSDRITVLRPLPGSERSSLTLTFRGGQTLEVSVSSEDYERMCKILAETQQLAVLDPPDRGILDGGFIDDDMGCRDGD